MTTTTQEKIPFRERTWDYKAPDEVLERHDKRLLKKAPTQQRGWDTINKIVDAAEAVLIKFGRDNFSIKLVLDELNDRDQPIADGTIYTYFDGKLPLLNYVWPERVNEVFIPTKDLPVVVTDVDPEVATSS